MQAFTADIALGLDRVYELADPNGVHKLNIVAVNLSLVNPFPFTSTTTCDGGGVGVALKPIIDDLRNDLGIVTIASSGNGGLHPGLYSPACISTVVSVGSTDDSDVVAKYTNIASFLDLLAPGGNACDPNEGDDGCIAPSPTDDGIESSVPGGSGDLFEKKWGTSMAAPHVTGAWALLKSSDAYPDPSIEEILHVLKKTGLQLLESTSGITKPRIQIDRAFDALIHAKDCPTNILNIDNFIFGTPGNDKLYGTSGNDLIIGFAGNDAMRGESGDDCLFGSSGDDNLSGGIGNDYLNGSSGVDNLKGDEDNDTIFAGAGNDILDGGLGDDKLNGGPGDDNLNGRAGADTMNGDDGSDILDGGDEDNAIDTIR